MTTVLTGMMWATDRGAVLRHVRHAQNDEPILQALFNVAVETCHEEIGRRDFTEPAIATTEWIAGMGLTEASEDEVLAAAAIPANVRYGVYEFVRVAYGLRFELPGVISQGNGSASQTLTELAANNLGDRPLLAGQSWWRRYLLDATTAGRIPT